MPSATDSPSAVSLPAGYLNVLVNSQWKSRWCSVRDSHLYFYQDRNRSKAAQQPLSLLGCEVVPDPSPDHLYSFRILHNGEELAKLEVPLAGAVGGGWADTARAEVTVRTAVLPREIQLSCTLFLLALPEIVCVF